MERIFCFCSRNAAGGAEKTAVVMQIGLLERVALNLYQVERGPL
jgi:hypothetical protein